MLIRRHHKLQPVRIRCAAPDDFEPAVILGPVFRVPQTTLDWWDRWGDDEKLPRRRINGRWLSARWASRVQWGSAIGHRGSRRGDRRENMRRRAAERCGLYRYTSLPF